MIPLMLLRSEWRMPKKGDEVKVHYVGTLEDGLGAHRKSSLKLFECLFLIDF